jgi:ABC-type nitrate/sulfonate/bicarbonate transport system substrate-binding protein
MFVTTFLFEPTASFASIFAKAKDFRCDRWRRLESNFAKHTLIIIKLFFLFFSFFLISTPVIAQEKVTLHLKWFHQFQFAGYFAALEKGYYKDVGLDVEILESHSGSTELNQKVISQVGNYGIGDTDLLLARNEGAPIVVLAVIFQHSPSILLTKRTSSTQSIHEIVGKRVMLAPNSAEIIAYLKKERIESSDYTPVEYSFNFDDLINGKVYAMNGYSTAQTYPFKKVHFDYQAYSPRSAGIDFYGDNLFTSEMEISEHPQRVKSFRKASLRGWQYAFNNQEEIIDLILNKYSPKIAREQLLYEAKQMFPLIQPELVELGYMNEGRWQHISEIYSDLGMIPQNTNLESFLYDPNPKHNLTWLYRSIFGMLGFFAIIGFFQWRRLNQNYKKNSSRRLNSEPKN